jgi:hypothetical protein
MVLASIIAGLESDTPASLETMRHFAIASGAAFAQFPLYGVYPGTKDYYEMIRDSKNADRAGYVPKHAVQIVRDKFWLHYEHSDVAVKHPTLSTERLMSEVHESWRRFYSLRAIIARIRKGQMNSLSSGSKIVYAVTCIVFSSLYPGGIAADNVRKTKLGLFDRLFIFALISLTRRSRDWFGKRPGKSRFDIATSRLTTINKT